MEIVRYHYEQYGRGVKTSLRKVSRFMPDKEFVFLCIGTDRLTGDALGPLVGTYLTKAEVSNVYGTIEDPVHSLNIKEVSERIKSTHPDAFVIAIDACLGKKNKVGDILFKDTPLKPGTGVNKELGSYGDMSIIGVVNMQGEMEHSVLQNTRLHIVMSMADVITQSLLYILDYRQRKFSIIPNFLPTIKEAVNQ